MYDPICGICRKKITASFTICEECQVEWGRYASDRPEWANYLVNYESARRYRFLNHHYQYIEDSDDGFGYEVDYEMLVDFRAYYELHPIEDRDGVFELQDSDWEGLYTWSL